MVSASQWMCGGACLLSSFLTVADPVYQTLGTTRGEMLDEPIGQKPGSGQMPRLELQPFQGPDKPVLPPLDNEPGELPDSGIFFIREINITGNTLIPEAELDQLKEPYQNKQNTLEEVFDLKNKLTMLYINRGYSTSGAVLDENALDGEVLNLRVIEGRLVKIRIEGNQFLSDYFLKSRLDFGDEPLNVRELEEKLQILRQEYMIENLYAELKPGIKPGETLLDLTIQENNPFKADLFYNNQRPPSIGSEQYGINLADRSLFGLGDVLSGWVSKTDGSFNYSASYSIPITPYDTRLSLSATKYTNAVVVAPFDLINIENDEEILFARLEQPVFRDSNHDVRLSVSYRHDNIRSFLLDSPFSFSPGVIDGKAVVNALSFGQDWIYRDRDQVLAVSSIVTSGLNVLDSTVNADAPDSTFWAWLGQIQYLRRLPIMDSQISFRSAVRLADSRMLPNEKFAVGGFYSVRGYRENFLTRDQGFLASLEYQVPLPWRLPIPWISKDSEDGAILIAFFGDYGRSWNKDARETPANIGSVGSGIIWRVNRESSAQLYYGYRLTAIEKLDEPNLQDDGIHFLVNLSPF
jgi:hemolysin activation/secretion protein